MKLKKGSPEAKKFMAKLRAKKNSDNLSPFYRGINARILSPSGYYEFYSDKQQRFLKADTQKGLKNLIDNELDSSDLSGWSKGNTRMIEMNKKPFKKLKNVRVKRTKGGVFNSFKVIPNMEQFIKDKRKSLSGTKIKVTDDILRFLESEGKNSKGFTYRAKILWGQEIVLKEKNGNPVEKFVIGNYDEAKYIASELNKGQEYTNVKTKKIKK